MHLMMQQVSHCEMGWKEILSFHRFSVSVDFGYRVEPVNRTYRICRVLYAVHSVRYRFVEVKTEVYRTEPSFFGSVSVSNMATEKLGLPRKFSVRFDSVTVTNPSELSINDFTESSLVYCTS